MRGAKQKEMFEISDLRRREILHLRSDTYVGLSYFLGFKILNFNIFGGFQKDEYFWGYEDFVDFFGGHHKIVLYLEVISMHFRVFSDGQGTGLGCLKFLIFFFGGGGGGGGGGG